MSRDQLRSLLDDRRQHSDIAWPRVQLRKSRNAAKALEIARIRTGVANNERNLACGYRLVIISRLPPGSF